MEPRDITFVPQPSINTQQLSSQLSDALLERDAPRDHPVRERVAELGDVVRSEAFQGRSMLSYRYLVCMVIRLASVAVVMVFL